MKTLLTTLAACAVAVASVAHAADPAAGREIAQKVCLACHGETGNSDNPAYPKLGGQHADYIVRALEDYKSGARSNANMSGFAATLSAADRENVAAWYASQSEGVHTMGAD